MFEIMNYDDFVIGINEGLILTHPLSKCKNIIDKEVGNLNIWYKIDFDLNKNIFNVYFDEILNENKIEYIFRVFNNLGYYISYFKLIKNKIEKYFPWINLEDYIQKSLKSDSVVMFFESRFDEKLKWKPKTLYHVTKYDSLNKIKKQGIRPNYTEKGDFRPDRVYLTTSLKSAQDIKKQMEFKDKLNSNYINYVILEIDVSEMNDLILYKDPRSVNVYSYHHFNPKNIKII